MGKLACLLMQTPGTLVWLSARDVIKQVWDGYLNHKFHIGSLEVSIVDLAFGILIFTAALLISRTVSKLIERQIAKRQYIDPGIRYTVARLIHYFILAVGVLYALKAAFSLDLTSIAVLFTALSVGIGFGLQYIASDIASGFILLFERPIRVGDRVTIDTDEGDVHSINLRTTIVMTNDRIAVIVPNSKLVRERVVNWSYGDPRARMAVPISVAPESDVDLVTRTLQSIPEGIGDVLKQPEPKVQFLKFGDSSLDFRLLVWTNKPRSHVQIRSDINYAIEKAFRDAEIELASPQFNVRVLNQPLVLDGDDLGKAIEKGE
ncbi:MAG TPA: mechanosensitive ion channel domain-containing protein [Pyrinomonadaceae bacterium]|nr:mechanosensitive ion channel domain-containing protein [Pyrinomonadaceae bacterium]